MRIQVEFREAGTSFSVGLDCDSGFPISFEEGFTRSTEPYSGSYEVTPKINTQVLPTRDRWLKENIVVQPIPYFEVGNTERGTTAIIGGI